MVPQVKIVMKIIFLRIHWYVSSCHIFSQQPYFTDVQLCSSRLESCVEIKVLSCRDRDVNLRNEAVITEK